MSRSRPITTNTTVFVGMIPLIMAAIFCATTPMESPMTAALFLIASYALPLMFYELRIRKCHRYASTGLDWDKPGSPDARRVVVKLIGMTTIVASLVAVHAVFRVYTIEQLHAPLFALVVYSPITIIVIASYFWFIDRYMKDPYDGYWAVGAWVCGIDRSPDWPELKNFFLGWVVKGFFLPIMFTYLVGNSLFLFDQLELLFGDPVEVALYLVRVAIILELTIVVTGYTLTTKLFDSHIRSTNPYLAAWVVTLVCYAPISKILSGQILHFKNSEDWSGVITDYQLLMWPWYTLLLLSFVAYVWGTAIYGLRWSNLTNRGIITEGPYRFTKHPDYVSKSAYLWLTAAPFLTATTAWAALTTSAALIATNLVYYGRARMEEKHLSEDPEYVAYALEMNERSIFAPLAHLFPFLIYKAPGVSSTIDHSPTPMPAE